MPLFISNINHHINTADSVTSFYKTVHFNPGCFHDSGYEYAGTYHVLPPRHTTSSEPSEGVKDEGGQFVKDVKECERSCMLNVEVDCQFWSFNTDFQSMGAWYAPCKHFSSVSQRVPRSGFISGPRACGSYGTSQNFVFSLAVGCV